MEKDNPMEHKNVQSNKYFKNSIPTNLIKQMNRNKPLEVIIFKNTEEKNATDMSVCIT